MSPTGRPEGEYRSAQREGDPISALESPDAERMIGLLEALLAEQRGMAERQSDALANHARAIAAQQALNRQALRWFCAFCLLFGGVAAITHAWHSIVWVVSG